MSHILLKNFICVVQFLIITFFFTEIPAAASSGDYDYSHRKRDCEVTVLTSSGEPFAGALVGIGLINNDFIFGGTIRGEGLDSIGEGYGDQFRNYFDVATPDSEMMWKYVMNCSSKCAPDYSRADSLVNWLLKKNVPIRGHNLFSNKNESFIPEWTRNLETAAFKQAMQERIADAMGHFKGKVSQWDLINEICHGEDGSLIGGSILEARSGDPNIMSWIMDEARKIDPEADFTVNDYNLITSDDQTAADQFISKVKPLSSKFEIVGAASHFGANIDKSSYEPKINYLAQQLGKPIFLTDVDFSFDAGQAPDKIEELMRTCFANPNVGGLIMGSWFRRYMRRSDITSYFIDSLNNETPAGQRWGEVRSEWKTSVTGSTDDSGKIRFNGFQGKYIILISCYLDTFYVEPGEGTKTVKVTYLGETAVNRKAASLKTASFIVNGIEAPVKLPVHYKQQLFLATYSLSGQQLSRTCVNLSGGKYLVPLASSCSRVFRIETDKHRPLFTGKITAVR